MCVCKFETYRILLAENVARDLYFKFVLRQDLLELLYRYFM